MGVCVAIVRAPFRDHNVQERRSLLQVVRVTPVGQQIGDLVQPPMIIYALAVSPPQMGQDCCCAQFPDFACCSARVMAWRKHTATWASLEDGAPPPVLFDGTNGYEPAQRPFLLHLTYPCLAFLRFPNRHSYLYLPPPAALADSRQSPQLTPATRDFRHPDVVHRECTSRTPGSSRRHGQGHLLD